MDKPTDKRILQIADYIWADPGIKSSDVVAHFVPKFRLSDRRIQTLLTKAREYNIERQNKASEIKDRVFIQKEIESVETAYNRRKRAIEILQDLADGVPQEIQVGRDDTGEAIYKTIPVMPNDRIRAIAQLAAMESWNSPIKTESAVNINGIDKPIEKMTEHELIAIAEGRINVS